MQKEIKKAQTHMLVAPTCVASGFNNAGISNEERKEQLKKIYNEQITLSLRNRGEKTKSGHALLPSNGSFRIGTLQGPLSQIKSARNLGAPSQNGAYRKTSLMGGRGRARATGTGLSSSKQDANQDSFTAKKDESKSLLRQTLKSEEFKRQIKADHCDNSKGSTQMRPNDQNHKQLPKVGIEILIPKLRVGEINQIEKTQRANDSASHRSTKSNGKSVEKVRSQKQIISYRANRVLVSKDKSDEFFENSVRLTDNVAIPYPTFKTEGSENEQRDKSQIEKIKNLDKDFEQMLQDLDIKDMKNSGNQSPSKTKIHKKILSRPQFDDVKKNMTQANSLSQGQILTKQYRRTRLVQINKHKNSQGQPFDFSQGVIKTEGSTFKKKKQRPSTQKSKQKHQECKSELMQIQESDGFSRFNIGKVDQPDSKYLALQEQNKQLQMILAMRDQTIKDLQSENKDLKQQIVQQSMNDKFISFEDQKQGGDCMMNLCQSTFFSPENSPQKILEQTKKTIRSEVQHSRMLKNVPLSKQSIIINAGQLPDLVNRTAGVNRIGRKQNINPGKLIAKTRANSSTVIGGVFKSQKNFLHNQEEIRQRFTSLGGLDSEQGDEDIFKKAHKTGNSMASMSNISLAGEAEEIVNRNKFSIGSINIKNPVAIKEGTLMNPRNHQFVKSDRQKTNASCPYEKDSILENSMQPPERRVAVQDINTPVDQVKRQNSLKSQFDLTFSGQMHSANEAQTPNTEAIQIQNQGKRINKFEGQGQNQRAIKHSGNSNKENQAQNYDQKAHKSNQSRNNYLVINSNTDGSECIEVIQDTNQSCVTETLPNLLFNPDQNISPLIKSGMVKQNKQGPYHDMSKEKQYLSFDSGRSKYGDVDKSLLNLSNAPHLGILSGQNVKKSSMMLHANRSMNTSSRPSLQMRGGSSKSNLQEMIYHQSMSQGGLEFRDYAQSSGAIAIKQKRQACQGTLVRIVSSKTRISSKNKIMTAKIPGITSAQESLKSSQFDCNSKAVLSQGDMSINLSNQKEQTSKTAPIQTNPYSQSKIVSSAISNAFMISEIQNDKLQIIDKSYIDLSSVEQNEEALATFGDFKQIAALNCSVLDENEPLNSYQQVSKQNTQFDQHSQNGDRLAKHKSNESFSVLSSQGAISSNANKKIYKNNFPVDFFQKQSQQQMFGLQDSLNSSNMLKVQRKKTNEMLR